MLTIDQTRNHGTADLLVGDSFRLQLGENPTTGYRWQLQSDGAPTLHLAQDSFEASGNLPGSGGMRYWVFTAAAAGSAVLKLELKRSWQPQAASTFDVTVSVKAC